MLFPSSHIAESTASLWAIFSGPSCHNSSRPCWRGGSGLDTGGGFCSLQKSPAGALTSQPGACLPETIQRTIPVNGLAKSFDFSRRISGAVSVLRFPQSEPAEIPRARGTSRLENSQGGPMVVM